MSFKRSFKTGNSSNERRSGLNRRWIKTPYEGVERRSGTDRRLEPADDQPALLGDPYEDPAAALEEIVFSNSVRLEALVRLLIEKEVLDPRDLAEMLESIHAGYAKKQIDHR